MTPSLKPSQKLVREALGSDKLTVKVEKLKNDKVSSVLTISEETRRMQDMMRMYAANGMDMGMFGGGEGETLVLNREPSAGKICDRA